MGRKLLDRPLVFCVYCGKSIQPRILWNGYQETPAEHLKRKYCGNLCCRKAQTDKKLAQPPTRAQTSRQRARRMMEAMIFANTACTDCGNTAPVMNIHHSDGNPLNNSSSNLVYLCRNCHVRRHRPKLSCTVCGKPVHAKNLCNTHYRQMMKIKKMKKIHFALEA